jgi:hypothetical protein
MNEISVDQWDEDDLVDLNGEQAKFVRAYIECGDKRASALAVWPRSMRPVNEANRLLRMPKVRTAIARARGKMFDDAAMSRSEILRELEYIARADPRDYFDDDGNPVKIHDLPDHAARAMGDMEFAILPGGGVVVTGTKSSKLKALEVLAKAAGLLDKETAAPPQIYNFDVSITPDPVKTIKAGGYTLDVQVDG